MVQADCGSCGPKGFARNWSFGNSHYSGCPGCTGGNDNLCPFRLYRPCQTRMRWCSEVVPVEPLAWAWRCLSLAPHRTWPYARILCSADSSLEKAFRMLLGTRSPGGCSRMPQKNRLGPCEVNICHIGTRVDNRRLKTNCVAPNQYPAPNQCQFS